MRLARPAVRGAGISARLLRAAIACAQTHGCQRITLLTDGVNGAAQRFYARQGFTPSSMLAMRQPL